MCYYKFLLKIFLSLVLNELPSLGGTSLDYGFLVCQTCGYYGAITLLTEVHFGHLN